jgi:RNA methyltransferase, TrmH family
MVDISSTQNPKIKEIVKLRTSNRTRRQTGITVVEGKYEIEIALGSGLSPIEIYVSEAAARQGFPDGLNSIPITVTETVFKKISVRENPDGWLALIPIPKRTLDSLDFQSIPLLVMAESVEKPGNLGAMLRTADAVGVDGFLVCDPRVDLYNPNVIRSSRGTIFSVQTIKVTRDETRKWLAENNIQVVATSPKGSQFYTDIDYRQGVCIAMGTEDEGLTEYWLDNATHVVQIPMRGRVNSLNVSTATAIILYEAFRQRHTNK